MSEKTIYIPSKRIYNNENPKILKNKYSSASIGMVKSDRKIEYSSVVGGIEETNKTNLQEIVAGVVDGSIGDNRPLKICEIEGKHTFLNIKSSITRKTDIFGVFSGITSRYHNVQFSVPIFQNFNLDEVKEIISGIKTNQNTGEKTPKVDISITNIVKTTPISATMRVEVTGTSDGGSIGTVTIDNYYKGATTEKTETEDCYDTFYVLTKKEYEGAYASIKVTAEDYTSCFSNKVDDEFVISTKFQTYLKTATLSGVYANVTLEKTTYSVPLSGTLIEKIPQKVTITAKGNVMTYFTEDYAYNYGKQEANSNTYSVDNNELFQNNTNSNGKQIDKVIGDSIIGGWENGKETAEITCSYNDYKEYDIVSQKPNSTNAISILDNTKPFQFDIGDVVCPQKATVSDDKPISTFKSGKYTLPKLFAVTGKGVKYDGALWQNLSLQETYPSFNINVLKNSNAITILNKTVTSSRAVEDQSTFDDCLHYGDNAIVEFSCASDYTFSNSNSGKYKSISMTTGTPNKININSVLGDIDVYLYADYNMLGPIFYSVTSDGTTWAFREIRNGNPTDVSCNVKVYNGTNSTGIDIVFPNGKYTVSKKPNPIIDVDSEATYRYNYYVDKTYTYSYESLRVNGITLTSSFQTIHSIGSGIDYTKRLAKYENGTLTIRSEYSEGATIKSPSSKTIFIPIYTGTFYAEQVLVAEETFTIPAYSNDDSYDAQRSICSGNVGVDGKTTIDTTFTTTTSVGETYTKNVAFTIRGNLANPQINYAEYDGSSKVYVEIHNPNPFGVIANLSVYYSDGNMYGSSIEQMQAYETAEFFVDVNSSLDEGSEVEVYFSYFDSTFQDSYNEYATIE